MERAAVETTWVTQRRKRKVDQLRKFIILLFLFILGIVFGGVIAYVLS